MKRILILLGLLFVSPVLLSVSAVSQKAVKRTSPSQGTPPSYCHPCLFYGGDFDPANPKANAVANMYKLTLQATVYIPFYVPAGQKWIITGLFSNNVASQNYINPAKIQWSISSDVSTGNSGTLIASGTAFATWTPTGRTFNNQNEFTALGHLTPQTAVTLTGPSVYWMSAVPMCTGNEGLCLNATYTVTDVEDIPAPNHKGVQPNDDSFFTLPSENVYYEPTWTPEGPRGGSGCDKFSAGLLGYAKPAE